jgi:hypothetical protein
MLDSGGYTAHKQGVRISLPAYADYVKRTSDIWTLAASLDVIGRGKASAERSYKNFLALRDMGAQVAPVWHVGEPIEALQTYLDAGEDYILMGGMVDAPLPWLRRQLDKVWGEVLTHADGSPKVKTHGFGMTRLELIVRYPWTSLDSTSWLQTSRFGSCVFLVGDKLQQVPFSWEHPLFREIGSGHYYAMSLAEQRVVRGWLEPFGVTAEQCARDYPFRDVVNAGTYTSLERLGVDTYQHESLGTGE